MRCVSYTRTTSCKSSESIPTDIIQQQNEQIQKYIQSHGWKLVAKYSDRKRDDNENTAFEEMTMDGISRKFDMVVVNSIDRCGKYISCAEDVLAKTFFPAGIHFSVVQDDFCSIEKSREEIDEYFRKEKIAVQIKSMREFAVREQIEGYYNVHDEKYGYILSEDRKELLVEEEAATIVREVFQMLLDGVSVKKIADIMNERGVESPMVHNARVGHKHWPHYENKWSEGSLALKGKVRCGNCRRSMVLMESGANDKMYCPHKKLTGKFSKCSDEAVSVMIIEGHVWYALQQVLYILDMIQEEIEGKANALDGVRKKKLKQLELENDKLKSERMRQYEAYAEGIITKDKYLLMKQQLTDKINRNETEMERLTHLSVEESAYKNKVASAIELLDGEMQHEKITQELVDATIDTVYVYDKKRIEVVFKFDDILMRAIEKYQKGEKEA